MICVSLIGMTPGIVCRNFFPFPNFPFNADDFQKFADSTILLNSRTFDVTPETGELIYIMRKKTDNSNIFWVGRYVYEPEPVHGRQGGYVGAGIWSLDALVDSAASIDLLRHLCARVKSLMSSRERSPNDFGNVGWDEVGADKLLIQRANRSIDPVETDGATQSTLSGSACYIDAGSSDQNYDMIALLNFAQNSDEFRAFDRIYITNSRRSAIADGNASNIKLIKISNYPERIRNSLVMEHVECAVQPPAAESSALEAKIDTQIDQLTRQGSHPEKVAAKDTPASGVDKLLKNRLASLESKHNSLYEAALQKWQDQKTMQVAIAATAAVSLVSVILSISSVAFVFNSNARPEIQDSSPPSTKPIAEIGTQPLSVPPVDTSNTYNESLYLQQKDKIVDRLNENILQLSNLNDLLDSPECHKFIPPANGLTDKNLNGAIACFRKIGNSHAQLRAIDQSLRETVRTLP